MARAAARHAYGPAVTAWHHGLVSATTAVPIGTPETAGRRRRKAPWWWRALRFLLALMVGLVLVVTLVSLGFNAWTAPPRTLPAPEGSDVTVGGVRVHYRQWGTTGRPVVLVHGFAESTAAWGPTAQFLARDHVVYAVDLAGYGYTEYTGHYTLPDEVGLVDGFVRALSLDHPVLVGHSLGASVVGGVALRDPSAIGGVIFADGDALPFGSGGNHTHRPLWILHTPYVISAYRVVTRSSGLGERVIRSQCGSTCLGLTPEVARAWMRPMQQADAEVALTQLAQAGVLHLTPQQIQAIQVPRAIIWGAEDTRSGGSLTATQRNLGDPPVRIIPKAGHLSMLADPAVFAQDVRELVAQMPAPKGPGA